jgi:type I restriction enzyme S subunit
LIFDKKKILIGAKFLCGYAFKSNNLGTSGVPVIKIGNIQNRIATTYNSQQFPFKLLDKKISKYFLQQGDILIAMTGQGSVGRVGKLKLQKGEEALLNQRVGKFICDEVLLNRDFLYYVISSQPFENYLFSLGLGSGQPNLSPETILNVEIPFPEYRVQSRIACILSSLDDKIELNRRMNQTLERIAQALFNHYFVDNIDPDNLPEGWKWGKLNEEFEITMGQSPEGSSYNQDCNGIPFFQGRTDFNFRFPSFRIYTTSPKRLAKKFDVLISVRAPVGDLNIALTDCCIGRGIGAIRNKMGYTSYTYYKIKSLAEIFKPYNGEGTVFGSINKDELGNISIIIPLKENVMAFEELVRPIDLKIYEMQKETKNLSSIRETLLPKLMSGEIDVSAVAKEEMLSEL